MRVLCMTLANKALDNDSFLPLELLAACADMIDAGLDVHWIDEPVRLDNEQRLIEQARVLDPDVVFFCCQSAAMRPVMVQLSISTGSRLGNDFVSTGALYPLANWRDALPINSIHGKETQLLGRRRMQSGCS